MKVMGNLAEAAGYARRIRSSVPATGNPSGDAWVFDAFLLWHGGKAVEAIRELKLSAPRRSSWSLPFMTRFSDGWRWSTWRWGVPRTRAMRLRSPRRRQKDTCYRARSPSPSTILSPPDATCSRPTPPTCQSSRPTAFSRINGRSRCGCYVAARRPTTRGGCTPALFRSPDSRRRLDLAAIQLLAGELERATGALDQSIRTLVDVRWEILVDGPMFRASETSPTL